MSSRQIRAFALSFVLAFTLSALPAAAATRDRDGGRDRDFPSIVKFLKRLPSFVVKAFDTMSLPKP